MINTKPSKQIPPKSQKAPSAPKTRSRSENVFVTTNVHAQLKAVAKDAAVPLILAGNSKIFRFNQDELAVLIKQRSYNDQM